MLGQSVEEPIHPYLQGPLLPYDFSSYAEGVLVDADDLQKNEFLRVKFKVSKLMTDRQD